MTEMEAMALVVDILKALEKDFVELLSGQLSRHVDDVYYRFQTAHRRALQSAMSWKPKPPKRMEASGDIPPEVAARINADREKRKQEVPEKHNRVSNVSKEDIEAMKDYVGLGWTVIEISEKFKRSRACVYNHTKAEQTRFKKLSKAIQKEARKRLKETF